MRLKTARVVDNLFLAPNTLTQRMPGPRSQATVALDLSHMKDGDVAGFSAFNGDSGILAVEMNGGRKQLVMSLQSVSLADDDKRVTEVKTDEKERVDCPSDRVYLRIDADFTGKKDEALFSYSLDNVTWHRIGTPCRMIFDYRRFFMGSKFAIFNYATRSLGGYVDVDSFTLETL